MNPIRTIFRAIRARMTLPKELAPGRNLKGIDVVELYIRNPESFWRGPMLRHAAKIHETGKSFQRHGVKHPRDLAELLISEVGRVRDVRQSPVFIMGAGGSGSTWLGRLVGDLPGYQYGREIYIPPGVSYLYRKLKTPHMSEAIWAIMLLHSCGYSDDPMNFDHEFVNSARSIKDFDILQAIWPKGKFIFLVRDPRDQVLSVTYRKADYRKAIAPDKNNLEYLLYNAKKYMKLYKLYKYYCSKYPNIIYTIKYEDLKKDTCDELIKLRDNFKMSNANEEIAKSVFDNDAENMRTGKVKKRGNLDEGGLAKDWRSLLTEKERNSIIPIIKKAVFEFRYDAA
jgi:hypothetical protein